MIKMQDFYEVEIQLSRIYQKYFQVLQFYCEQEVSVELYQKLSDRYLFQLEEVLLLEGEFWKDFLKEKKDLTSFFNLQEEEDFSFLFDSTLNYQKRICLLARQKTFLEKIKQLSLKDVVAFREKKEIYDQFCTYEFLNQFFLICEKGSHNFSKNCSSFFQFYRNLLYYSSSSFKDFFKEIRKCFLKSGFSIHDYHLYKALLIQDDFEAFLDSLNELNDYSFWECFYDAAFQILFVTYIHSFPEIDMARDTILLFVHDEKRRKELNHLIEQIQFPKLQIVK